MLLTNLKRIIHWGLVNFLRNGIVSFSSVLVMVIALSMIVSTVLMNVFLESTLSNIEEKIDINVYLSTGATEENILKLKQSLELSPEVKSVEYISKDEALAEFNARHQNDTLTIQALDELDENPFRARLNVQAVSSEYYESINNYLSNDPALSSEYGPGFIDKVNYADNKLVIERMAQISEGAERLAVIVILVLVGISVLITFNTIRLAIYISREEIAVMKLVGASNTYVRGPFIIEGTFYGIVAAIITVALFYPVTLQLKNHTEEFFGGIDLFKYYVDNFEELLAVALLVGIALGAVSSYLAVRRYLKK